MHEFSVRPMACTMAWMPCLECDGHTAESRAQWLVANRGLDYEAAQRLVIDEFPLVFANPQLANVEPSSAGPSTAITWRPDAMCDGHTAASRAQWLVTNKGLSIDDARTAVYSEFILVFATASVEPRVATVEQRCHLRDTGYLVMHSCVDPDAVRAARQCATVQAVLGCAGAAGAATWSEGGGSDPALLALALPIWPTVRELLGDDTPFPSWAQVTIKTPDGGCTGAAPGEVPPDAHIDGLHAPHNGVPPGEIRNFTLLCGVALTDMPAPNMGNLGVVPCSHRALARAVGTVGLEAAAATLSAQDGASATERLNRLLPLGSLGPAQPLCAAAGAAVLAHYQTVHFVQPNAGREPRIMVYFRVTSPARPGGVQTRLEALTPQGLFLEWPGLTALPP